MGAPAYELVGTSAARLRTYAPLSALIGENKVYLRPSATATTPYVVMGDATTRRGDGTELRSTTVDLTIHAFSDSANALQDVRQIADLVAEALHHYPLAFPTKTLVTLEHRGERVFYDSNGTTGHAVIELTAIVEAP